MLVTTPTPFPARLAETAETIDATLSRLLAGGDPEPGEIARPERLMEAMRYATLAGGKRLRPFLVVETARLFGAEGEGVLRAAAAVEFVHCYSLVHDDLPAMDDDDLRRGRPTTHRAYDEATAILVGDALLTLAFDVLASAETDPDPSVQTDLVRTLARASGLGGMVGGQLLDLAAEGRFADGVPLALSEQEILQLQAMKTGALLAASVEMGAILGGASARERAKLLGTGAGKAPGLWPHARPGIPDRRRPAGRGVRRRDARQEHRQGPGEGQGHPRPDLGHRCRPLPPAGSRRDGGADPGRIRREGRNSPSSRVVCRRTQQIAHACAAKRRCTAAFAMMFPEFSVLRACTDALCPQFRFRAAGNATRQLASVDFIDVPVLAFPESFNLDG